MKMINVRGFESRIKTGVAGRALQITKERLEKVRRMDVRPDMYHFDNNDGIHGTEIVVTKEGNIELCAIVVKKYELKTTFIKIGQFQPEFGVGHVYFGDGKEKEYAKLGNVINAINKFYGDYGIYFDVDRASKKYITTLANKAYRAYIEDGETEINVELLSDEYQAELADAKKEKEELEYRLEVEERINKATKTLTETVTDYISCEKAVDILKELVPESETEIEWNNGFGYCVSIKDKKFSIDTLVGIATFQEENNLEKILSTGDVVIKIEYAKASKMMLLIVEGEVTGVAEWGNAVVKRGDIISPSYNFFYKKVKCTDKSELEKKSGFEVRLVNISTGEIAQTMDAPNMRMAEKIESGILRHLNTDNYYTEIVDLAQSKDIKDATPEEVLEIAEELGLPSLDEEVSPEPTPEDVIEWQGLEKNKTYTNKSEEKEMNTINKNALNNRMVKLGEFLKENTDKQEIENKVFELFPKAMEVEVFNSDNVVYFLVGQDYVGKAPTKKEMKEKDYLFDSIDRMYGLSVHISVDEDKIKMDASIGVDYSDEYGHSHYTDCTVKEIEIELELTMEKAKRKAEYLRELHKNGKIRATYGWDKIRELSLRETTDEVLDFLIEELTYYACEEKKEKEKNNVEHIQYKIEKAHYSFAVGTESVEKILISLKRLYQYCHNDELKKQVDETVALYEKAEDSMWRESVRKQVTELVEKRQKAMVQRNIDKLEKAVTGKVSYEDARKILDEFAIYIKREWKEDTKGYRVVTEPMRSKCFGVGNEKNITGGCEKIICTRGLQYGIEWKEDNDTMVMFVEGIVEYMKDGEVVTDEKHCIFKKEINCNPDPEKDELDSIEESEVVTEKPEQTRLDDTSQPKKRKYATIEQYDYVNKEEFEKHRKEMEDAGFRLINGIYGGLMDAGELGGSETWTYTASYIKSDMY